MQYVPRRVRGRVSRICVKRTAILKIQGTRFCVLVSLYVIAHLVD